MKLTIGKATDNDIVIDDPYMSRHHAVLSTGENGELILEDAGSTNGTFVNDIRIVKKKVVPEDGIVLGKEYTLTINELLHKADDYSDDFGKLKPVYDDYIREKIRIQSRNQFKTRLFQSLPFALIGVVGVIFGFLGHAHKGLFIFSFVLAVLAPTVGIYFGARQAAKIPALLQNLANRFKTNYVCPKCGTFLGEIPYESLSNKKQCPVSSCKAKWIRT
ncbi:MAG: FHA domain-containing protein [Tannerella sp.]|jgi:hypothetical protein|nr:FHA domain-containing protein [Tannerella sp.]